VPALLLVRLPSGRRIRSAAFFLSACFAFWFLPGAGRRSPGSSSSALVALPWSLLTSISSAFLVHVFGKVVYGDKIADSSTVSANPYETWWHFMYETWWHFMYDPWRREFTRCAKSYPKKST